MATHTNEDLLHDDYPSDEEDASLPQSMMLRRRSSLKRTPVDIVVLQDCDEVVWNDDSTSTEETSGLYSRQQPYADLLGSSTARSSAYSQQPSLGHLADGVGRSDRHNGRSAQAVCLKTSDQLERKDVSGTVETSDKDRIALGYSGQNKLFKSLFPASQEKSYKRSTAHRDRKIPSQRIGQRASSFASLPTSFNSEQRENNIQRSTSMNPDFSAPDLFERYGPAGVHSHEHEDPYVYRRSYEVRRPLPPVGLQKQRSGPIILQRQRSGTRGLCAQNSFASLPPPPVHIPSRLLQKQRSGSTLEYYRKHSERNLAGQNSFSSLPATFPEIRSRVSRAQNADRRELFPFPKQGSFRVSDLERFANPRPPRSQRYINSLHHSFSYANYEQRQLHQSTPSVRQRKSFHSTSNEPATDYHEPYKYKAFATTRRQWKSERSTAETRSRDFTSENRHVSSPTSIDSNSLRCCQDEATIGMSKCSHDDGETAHQASLARTYDVQKSELRLSVSSAAASSASHFFSLTSTPTASGSYSHKRFQETSTRQVLAAESPASEDSLATLACDGELSTTAVNNSPRSNRKALESETVKKSPDVYKRLRGAEETWNAIQKGLCIDIKCNSCQSKLYCIQDIDFVSCPLCKNVVFTSSKQGGGGLGLGMTRETLSALQFLGDGNSTLLTNAAA